MVCLNLTMLLCILWSSNCCESNTQIVRNPVFLNSLFCTCIPILFLSIFYPCIVRILKFKQALTQLLLLQIRVKENLVWFVLLGAVFHPSSAAPTTEGFTIAGTSSPDCVSPAQIFSPPQAATTTALPSSTVHMTLRTTRVRKRGRTLPCLVTLCIA